MPPVVNVAAVQIWGGMILGQRGFGPGNWNVHLFVNFHLPVDDDTVGQYTECTWPGYSPFELNPFEWVFETPRGAVAVWAYPLLTWVFDAAVGPQQTAFGYYVEQNGVLLYAEAFTAPFPIPAAGGTIPIQLFFTDEQCAS